MSQPESASRRRLLKSIALAVPLATLAVATRRAQAAPLLGANDPEAKAVGYVEEASQAKGASPGASCANCGLYQGASGSAQGPCQLFAGRDVRASGWCSSWAPQM